MEGQERTRVRFALENALLRHLIPVQFRNLSPDEEQDFYYLLLLVSISMLPMPRLIRSVFVKFYVGKCAAAIGWVASMALNPARTTEAVVSFHGLVNGL